MCTFEQSFALHFEILKGLCLILLFVVMYAARHQKEKRKIVTLKGIETIRRTQRKFGNIFAIDRKQARLRKLCCKTEKKNVDHLSSKRAQLEAKLKSLSKCEDYFDVLYVSNRDRWRFHGYVFEMLNLVFHKRSQQR